MLSKSENLLHKLETNLQQNQKISIEEITEICNECNLDPLPLIVILVDLSERGKL